MPDFAVTGWLIASVSLPVAIFALVKLRHYESRSLTDDLTGLYNQRWLWETLGRIMKRLARDGQSTVVVFLDLDGFKKINDTKGHLAGDRALSAVAIRLRDCVRPTDYCVRYGGDEFVIILPSTKLQDGCEVAEKILSAIASSDLGVKGWFLSASVGVAESGEGLQSPVELVEKADRRAYHSKLIGGDRVTCLGEGVEHL